MRVDVETLDEDDYVELSWLAPVVDLLFQRTCGFFFHARNGGEKRK